MVICSIISLLLLFILFSCIVFITSDKKTSKKYRCNCKGYCNGNCTMLKYRDNYQDNNSKEEPFVENLDIPPSSATDGQIMLTDDIGNLSTFNVGTGKTLVSDSTGKISTITTGQFDVPLTANVIKATDSINSEKIVSASKVGVGSASIVAGGTGNTTGVINFNYSNGSRKSYIGGEDAANPNYTELNADAGSGFSTNKNFIVKGQITGNLTGNSTTTDRLRLIDTRNDNSPPSYYASKPGLTYEFKIAATIGISGLNGFILLQTLVPWSDNSGGLSIQQTATIGKEKYTRYAMPQDTKWGEWENQYYNSFTTVSSPDTTFTPASAWNVVNDSDWDASIRSPYLGRASNNPENDQSAVGNNIDIVVPAGMRTGYVHYLPWNNCRYFDIVGVFSNNTEVFIKRINSYFYFEGMNNKGGYHDGMAISAVPRADRFSKIRIKGVKGRIHYMGMAWNNDVVSSDNTGFLNTDNLVGNFSSGLTSSGLINANAGLTSSGVITANAGLNIWNSQSTPAMNTHFSYSGDGQNYISGNTNIRGGEFCIYNDNNTAKTCINQTELSKLKQLLSGNFNLKVDGQYIGTTNDGAYIYNRVNRNASKAISIDVPFSY